MSTVVRLVAIRAASEPFAQHHGVTIPVPGASLRLGPSWTRGGFGALHRVEAIDGAPPARALVAKLFDADALALQGGSDPVVATIGGLHHALAARGPAGWPDAVLGLPICLAVTEVAGRQTLAALMLDLRELGFVDAPFTDRARSLEYIRRPARERVQVAVQLAKRAALLECVGLLHGDLNPENVLLHPDTLDVQIIDFDSGVIVVTGDERPRTPGKPGDCVPPEIKGITAGGVPADVRLYTAAAERWSIGSLVGYCAFGCHPGFFLRSISRANIERYAREPGGWPEIDVDGALFTTIEPNRIAYGRMRADLQALPAGGRDLFTRFFAAGCDGAQRPSAAEWQVALLGLLEPPVIEQFSVSDEWVLEGSQIVVTWRVRNATHVELEPGGRQPIAGSTAILVSQPTVIALRAVNTSGSVREDSPVVRVVAMPRIDVIGIPEGPDLESALGLPFGGGLTQTVGVMTAPAAAPSLQGLLPTADAPVGAGTIAAPDLRSVFAAPAAVLRAAPGPSLPAAPRAEDFFTPSAPAAGRRLRRRRATGGRD